MEIMVRCELPDEPGMLAEVAGTIGKAGGDIQSVDVVEHHDGRVLDDLLIVVDAERGASMLEQLAAIPNVDLVHAGPSRGHPGDAMTRLAVSLEALLTGQAEADLGLATLIGGQLRASSAELSDREAAPAASSKTMVLDVDERVLALTRDYRFTDTERDRAEALLRLSLLATGQPARTSAG